MPLCCSRWTTAFLLTTVSLLLPAAAAADGVNGFVDLVWNNSTVKTEDAAGQSAKTEVNSYLQRYNLLLNKTLFPKLRLDMAGVFEKDISKVRSDDMETDSKNTRFRPSLALTLQDPFYTAGVGYYLREARQQASPAPTVTTVSEDYNAFLGFRPAGLPSLDVRYAKTNLHDGDRQRQDSGKDYVSLTSHYAFKGLDLRYLGAYTATEDRLNGLETKNTNHQGRGAYSGSFFNGRAVFSTSYNIVSNATTTASTGREGGTVADQQFPSGGISAVNDTPALGALEPNPALINADLTASSGVNIGLPPIGGDLKARQIGLDFLIPTEVNNLLIWVDRELPADIAASFSWDIYASSDNLNWTFIKTVFPALFGPFQNRFEIDLPATKSRYIKAAVKPLAAAVIGAAGFPEINITELQAFVKRPVGAKEEKFTSRSQTSNTSLRYMLLDSPFLYYDASYFITKKDPADQEVSFLSNGLSLNHRFNEIFSGTARAAREDGEELKEKRTAYTYNVSLLAAPLRTLSHSLVFSARDEEAGGASRRSNAVFLNNTAQLYRGVDASLNGGYTSTTETDGAKTETTLLTAGVNLVPHPAMALNIYLTDTKTDRSRPDGGNYSNSTRSADLNLTYNPFRTLYLSAALQVIDETNRPSSTLQNYGLTWSPFPDGDLQFRFSYTESRRSEDDATDRTVSPGLRYRISNRSFFDLGYQSTRSSSPNQKVETETISANLKIFL